MIDQNEQTYLLLDSRSIPLAQGRLEGPLSAQPIQIHVLDGKEDEVARHEVIQLVCMGQRDVALQCQLIRQRGERVLLNKVTTLGAEFRRNLRVPVSFQSYIYPLSGKWKGRREIQSADISCGGIAFYSECGLEFSERVEIVIPITTQPVVLHCEILRSHSLRNNRAFYSAKFVDMSHDEERVTREAVFRVQLQDRHRYTGENGKGDNE